MQTVKTVDGVTSPGSGLIANGRTALEEGALRAAKHFGAGLGLSMGAKYSKCRRYALAHERAARGIFTAASGAHPVTRASHAAPARSSLEALGLDRTTAEDIAKGLNELGPV